MEFDFSGEVWYWRGPAPFYFVSVPPEQSAEIKAAASRITFGWGMIPVNATIGRTTWYTAMFEKDGLYALPIKADIRKREGVQDGETIAVHIEITKSRRSSERPY